MIIHENLLYVLAVICRLLALISLENILANFRESFHAAFCVTHTIFTNFWPSFPWIWSSLNIKLPKDGRIWWFNPLPKMMKAIFLRECIYNLNGIDNTNSTASKYIPLKFKYSYTNEAHPKEVFTLPEIEKQ